MHTIDHWYNSVLVSWRACMGHTKNAGECDSSMPRACCILVKWEGGRAVLFTYAVEVWKDSSMALSSPGLIWSSCLQTVQSPTWTLMVIGTSSFASDFSPRWATGRRFSNAIHHLWPVNTNSNQTARNLYVLHFKHQGNRYACRSLGGFEVMEHLRSSHQLQLLPWHPGMNTDKGIKRWTDLMHGRDTAVPGNLSRLKSTQIRHYCLTRNYRLHCRSKEKRTNPDRIHNNYFTCLEEHENGSTDTSVCGGKVVFIGSGGVMSEWGRLVMFYCER